MGKKSIYGDKRFPPNSDDMLYTTMGARYFLVDEMMKIFKNQCIELFISNIMADQSIFKTIFSSTQTPFHKSLRPQQ